MCIFIIQTSGATASRHAVAIELRSVGMVTGRGGGAARSNLEVSLSRNLQSTVLCSVSDRLEGRLDIFFSPPGEGD